SREPSSPVSLEDVDHANDPDRGGDGVGQGPRDRLTGLVDRRGGSAFDPTSDVPFRGPIRLPEFRDPPCPIRVERTDSIVRMVDEVLREEFEDPRGERTKLFRTGHEDRESELVRQMQEQDTDATSLL